MEDRWLELVTEAAGFAGAGLIAAAYLLNQRRLLRSEDWRFPAANLAGSCLVMLSLSVHPNLPSVAIELFWSAISVYGIVRNLRTPVR